jgi:apolipoprotein N-acyltransferase
MPPTHLVKKYSLIILSFFLVAFGQPVWTWWTGLLAAFFGFALFWRVLLDISLKKERFIVSMGWFAAVQMVQLGWFASHPFIYIYAVLFFCAYLMGAQFGFIGMLIQPAAFDRPLQLLAIASLWTLFEWSRLFILSGLSFNPVGLALSGSIYPLQFAALGGAFFLSFWVMATNLFVLRAWIKRGKINGAIAGSLALFPYLFGVLHYHAHYPHLLENQKEITALLVQPALPLEENQRFMSAEEARQAVLERWKHVIGTTVQHRGKPTDLIVLPEYVVPYGTFPPVFPIREVKQLFSELFGKEGVQALPPLKKPLADYVITDQGMRWLVSNAFIVQGLANFFHSYVIAGLEDSVYLDETNRDYASYSSAFHFKPEGGRPERYDKRVLVPMGEYIPFKWCRQLASRYGISGSFTPGVEARCFNGPVACGAAICYEETYGDLMRENRQKGALLLVNLTNDGWYPHSRLPKQHFDHARLRTVENGIPLIRACNTGITGGVNSLGEVIDVIGPDFMRTQKTADAIHLKIPIYTYSTLYARWGDRFILSLSSLIIFSFFLFYRAKK